jgi:hypothetical protein
MSIRLVNKKEFQKKKEWAAELGEWVGGRDWNHGDFLPNAKIVGLTGEEVGRPQVRDALVRHAAFSESWEETLTTIFAKTKEQDVFIVDPEDYIRMASGEEKYPKGGLVLVNGDVQIPSWSEFPGKELRFPPAVIKGSLEIFNTSGVREIDCCVAGWLSLTNCQKIDRVGGEVFGSVSLNDVEVSQLGADLRCAGNLMVFHCPKLHLLNCEVGGGASVVNSGLTRTGPAFSSGGCTRIVNCHDFQTMEGVFSGNVEFEIRKEKPERETRAGKVVNCANATVMGKISSKGVEIASEDKGGTGLARGGANSLTKEKKKGVEVVKRNSKEGR